MRRISRWLLNALTAVSLLMCVAAILLWVRSFRVTEYVRVGRADVSASRGYCMVAVFDEPKGPPDAFTGPPSGVRDDFVENAALGGHRWHLLAGFGVAEYGDAGIPEHARLLLLPYYAACAAAGALPLLRIWAVVLKRRANRRRARGACAACSYDLTGNVSGVCPECGTAVAKLPA